MIKEFDKTLNAIKKLNELYNQKILDAQMIEEAFDNLVDLRNLKNQLNIKIKELDKSNIFDSNNISRLCDIDIGIIRIIGQIDTAQELIEKTIGNYRNTIQK